MKLYLVAAVLTVAPCIASAGVCDTAWEADRIVSTLSGRPSYLKIPLKDKNQNTNEVTLAQVRAFHDAKEKIARVVGMSPTFIICGDRDPNAFASSGSKGDMVGVTLGMLRLVDGDPDMAAAIIGHEFAHHVKQHGAADQSRNAVLGIIGLIAGIALEYNIQKKHGVGGLGLDLGAAGSTLVSRKFDRDQEREADDLGFQYMIAAGFNPLGSVRLAERLSRLGSGGTGWFFDSHPGWDERGEIFRTKIANSPQAQNIIASAQVRINTYFKNEDGQVSSTPFSAAYQSSLAQDQFNAALQAHNKEDYATALKLAELSATSGLSDAQVFLGFMYEKGLGVNEDINKAISWYAKASELGNHQAQVLMGLLYEKGKGVPLDFNKAAEQYKNAMDNGSRRALVRLAVLYSDGRGVPMDRQKSIELINRAILMGDQEANLLMAISYERGIGVETNQSEALKYLERAVSNNYSPALIYKGTAYLTARLGLERRVDEAIRLFEIAANSGNPIGNLKLGIVYEQGLAGEKNMDKATEHYKMAASLGEKEAIFSLYRIQAKIVR